jgi:hypothetical protein
MKTVRSISAILLAVLVLVSSSSFMVGMHICMGEIQNVALFTKADGCEKEKNLPPCHRHQNAPCCDDETIVHRGEDFKASIDQIQIVVPAPFDIEQPLVLISEIIPSAIASRVHYYNYDPPLRPCDLTVEHQVFLI